MNHEEFMVAAARDRLAAKKYTSLSERQRAKMIEFCLLTWKQSSHRGEDALRKMETFAKKL